MRVPWMASAGVLLVPWLAAAQPAASLRELALRLERGDRIVVEPGGSGPSVSGRVVTLTPDALTLSVDGDGEQTFAAAEIQRVVRKGDSLANGLRWGLALGAGLGCATTVALVDGAAWRDCPAGAIVVGPLFLGIAVLVDAAHTGSTEVFRAAPAGSAAGGRGRRVGLGVAWSW